MKRLKYNPKIIIAAMATSISLVTTGCGGKISDRKELEQSIEALEATQHSLELENEILLDRQTSLQNSVDKFESQRESLANEIVQLQNEKDTLETQIEYLKNYEFDIDNLYVVNYSVLYKEDDYYQAKPYYHIATRESNEILTEECSYIPGDVNNSTGHTCYADVYKTIESPCEYIFVTTHYLTSNNKIVIEVLSNKKNATLNSSENKEQTYLVLDSFMVPLFQVIQQEDYREILTREQLLEIVNKMNQGNYFDDTKQLITKRPQ